MPVDNCITRLTPSTFGSGTGIVQEALIQATIGTYVGGGVDFAIGRYLMLGAGYHLIADFSEPIRGRRNFSGPELSFSLSFLWGKDVGAVKGIRR